MAFRNSALLIAGHVFDLAAKKKLKMK